MPNDPVADAVEGAKKTLANANNFTKNVEGNPTSMFAPKAEPKHISGVPSYKQAHAARKEEAIPGGNPNISDELNARKDMEKGAQ
jgi:hypothetical protein